MTRPGSAMPDAPGATDSRRGALWWLGPLFWAVAAFVLGAGIWYATTSRTVGTWDAASNLVAARNIAEGKGFTTDFVQDLVVPHELPDLESVRAPGAVYLIGALFRLTGVNLATPVLVNVAWILLSAIILRAAIAAVGPPWLASIVGLLMLLGANNYVVVPYVNNNLLVLLTVVGLWLAVRADPRSGNGWWIAVASGALTGFAFLTKQTYILGFVPFTIILIGTLRGLTRVQRLARLVAAGAVTLVVSAPYLVTNIVRHGTPIHSPIQQLRLPVRYGIIPVDGFQRRVLFDQPAPRIGDIAESIGVHGMLSRNLEIARQVADAALGRGLLVVFWAMGALIFVRRHRWHLYAMAGMLAVPGFFDSLWWVPEPRYLYPLYAVLLFVAALGTIDYLEAPAAEFTARVRQRIQRAFGGLMAVAFALALLTAQGAWRAERSGAEVGEPAWAPHVRRIPPDAVVLTSAVPHVPWWTRRRAVIEPWGTRSDLERVMQLYAPTHYLDVAPGPRSDRPEFEPGELVPLAGGEGWELHAIATGKR